MDVFARKQLEKYGWVEGQGLGKESNGIAQPIKVKIKRDHRGVGLPAGEEFTDCWWSAAFNKALGGVSVEDKEDGVVVKRKKARSSSGVEKQQSMLYGMFLKSGNSSSESAAKTNSVAAGSSVRSVTTGVPGSGERDERTRGADDVVCRHTRGRSLVAGSSSCADGPAPSDECLLRACGGRTAHKAARHGLELSGKLKRIEEQEDEFYTTTKTSTKTSKQRIKNKYKHSNKKK